jgi:uncharacterized membrane protein (DUF2068 family)
MPRTHQVGDVQRGVLRSVAILELAKGLLVVLVGLGLLSLSRRGHDFESIAKSLLGVLHFNRHRHLSEVFLNAARFGDTNLIRVAVGAGVYSAMRFVESYGLWRQRVWAEWLALIFGAAYLPLEIYELSRKATVVKWAVFLLNLVIVFYMAYLRVQDRPARDRDGRPAGGSEEVREKADPPPRLIS